MTRLAIALVLIVSGCAGAAPRPNTARRWAAARSKARELLAVRYHKPIRIYEPVPRIPYLFVAGVPDRKRNNSMVLLHRGRIYDARGLDALAAYLRQVDLLRRPAPSAQSMVRLWLHLTSPPWDRRDVAARPTLGFAAARDYPALAPRLDWARDRAVLRLYYLLPQPGHAGDGSRPRGPGGPRDVIEWQLIIPRSYQLRLRKRRHRYDQTTKRLIDG